MKKNLMTTMLVMILAAALTATGCNTAAEQTTQTAVETITETDAETTDGASEQEETQAADPAEEQTEKMPDSESFTGGSEEKGGQNGPGGMPGEKPDGQPGDGGTPPAKPDGEGGRPGQGGPGGMPGEKPGDGGTPPAKPDGEGGRPGQGGPGGAPGQSSADVSYTAVNTVGTDTDLSGQTLISSGTDENAVLVTDGAAATLNGVTVERTSADSTGGDSASFYGVGAAILVTDGTAYVNDAQITTDAAGGTGVFAYGDGVACVSDSVIRTAQSASGGIHVAGGGTLYAWDLDVETAGGSAAAIRLFDCDLSGSMADDTQNDCTWNVILYQSMSGDSQVGNSTFEMVGGTLTAANGGMFYTTNTESTFILKDVDISYAEDSAFFLKVTGNNNARGWGSTGSNGADCTFTAVSQEMEGNVIWDSVSTLDFYMTDGSTLTGAVVQDESNAGDGGDGSCTVTVDASSKWVVTADSVLTALHNAGTVVDAEGKTVTVAGTDGTVYVQGDSSLTVTVESYDTTADLGGASAVTAWEDYQVEKPAQLG